MIELTQLFIFWGIYLEVKRSVGDTLVCYYIEETIKALEELKKLKGGER